RVRAPRGHRGRPRHADPRRVGRVAAGFRHRRGTGSFPAASRTRGGAACDGVDESMTQGQASGRSWLRRNAVALVAVAVLLPGTAAAVSLNAWQDLLATTTTTVAPGETARLGAVDVGDARARFDSGVEGIPRGTRVV